MEEITIFIKTYSDNTFISIGIRNLEIIQIN